MTWTEIHIITSADLANRLSDELSALGAEAVTLQDAGNQPIFETSGDVCLWTETVVIGLFQQSHSLDSVIHYLESAQNKGLIKGYQLKPLENEDWERRCLDSFQPLHFGKRLCICPSWHTPPNPKAVNVILDPGLAFGTGTHTTTQLCLEWLEANIISQDIMVDYGCGSGILAISALKLGAKKAVAVDTDVEALDATEENSRRNHIDSKRLITLSPEEMKKTNHMANILVANILAKPLIELAPYFSSITKSWCKIVLSGILCDQAEDVLKVYKAWFRMKDPIFKNEWALLEGLKI